MAAAPTLAGRYEIGTPLGSGGMASVYRGADLVLDRPVAVKVLAGRFAGDQRFISRFRREARAAAGLNHPNVVSVYDTGEERGRHYIVMEYVEGETLEDLISREGPLEPARAAAIAQSTARALDAAHARGLVHRDVKPANIMLAEGGEVKVMDFGIARAAEDDTLTQSGTVLGTAAYMSPEQARGGNLDGRSDVYSLGCVLYEMLTGRPPFVGESTVAVAYAHVHDEPAPPSAHRPGIPADLDRIVLRALAKDPSERFPSAASFDDALGAALDTEEMATEALAAPIAGGGDTEVLPEARRRWWPIAALALAILLLVVGGLLAFPGAERPTRDAPGGERAGDRRAESPAPSPEPAAPGVEEAATVVVAAVSDGVAAGEVSEEAAGKILDHVEKAVEEHAKGEPEHALDEVFKADDEVEKAVAEGQIISLERAEAIDDALEGLGAAVQAAIPTPAEEEGGEDGHDGGGPPATAPGQEKKDEGD